MQQNHETEVETEEIDIAEDIEAKIFSYVITLEKTFETIHALSRFFKDNEGFLLQQANREQLSIPAQEFISYVMKGSPSRIPQYMLESALREYERTGGDEYGNLDLFKNPALVREPEEEETDQPEEIDQPETESVEESVEDVPLDQPEKESKPKEEYRRGNKWPKKKR